MTTTFRNGREVEVGMFGYESVIGVSALMGTKQSLNRVYMQIAGWGYRCRFEAAVAEFGLRCVQTQLVQSAQSAGCNAEYSYEQRLARWLLICADRVHVTSSRCPRSFYPTCLGAPVDVTLAAVRLKKEN